MAIEQTTMIEWTKTKRNALQRALNTAIKKGATEHGVFEFDGNNYIVGYARYLIQYIDGQLSPQPRRTYARSRGGR